MKNVLWSVVVSAFVLLATGCGPKFDNKITVEGVGSLKFGAENPEMGKPFTTAIEKESYYGEEYEFYAVRDKDSNLAVTYDPDYMMTVLSPEFETEEGLKVGMTLAEAVKILGDRDIAVIMADEEPVFYFEYAPEFAFELPQDAMIGGQEAVQQYYMYADRDLTPADFDQTTKIAAIKVRKNQ